MRPIYSLFAALFAVMLVAGWTAGSGPLPDLPAGPTGAGSTLTSRVEAACLAIDPSSPDYYSIDLVGTRKVPGARMAQGTGSISFVPSPFGVAISPEGTYVYEIEIQLEKANAPEGKAFVGWVTTPSLDQVVPLGRLDDNLNVKGTVAFNKYLVVVTLEPDEKPGERWTGPVVARGMSRSGFMHTMAGHGPFAAEPCAVYGYR